MAGVKIYMPQGFVMDSVSQKLCLKSMIRQLFHQTRRLFINLNNPQHKVPKTVSKMPEGNHRRRDRQKNKDKDDKKIILVKKEKREESHPTESSASQPKLLLKPKVDPTKTEKPKPEDRGTASLHASSSTSSTKPSESSHQPIDDSHSVLQMAAPQSILTSEFVLNLETVVPYMQESNHDYLVVAVVGLQNAGKSTLLNIIADETVERTGEIHENSLFKTRLSSSHTSIVPVTEGIDMYVSKDRVILLDCEPFLTNFNYNEYVLYELEELKILVFLLSICNVLVVVQDSVINPSLMRLLCCAELMRSSNKEQKEIDRCANVMFVHNKVSKKELDEVNVKKIKSIYKTIFATSKLNIYSNAIIKNSPLDEEFINYMPFPNVNQFSFEDRFELTRLKQCIANFKYKVRINKNDSISSQTTGQINEKLWLQSVQKSWEANSSNFFLKKYLTLKDKFNLLNHVVINDRNVYYPDE